MANKDRNRDGQQKDMRKDVGNKRSDQKNQPIGDHANRGGQNQGNDQSKQGDGGNRGKRGNRGLN